MPNAFDHGEFEPTLVSLFEDCLDSCAYDPACKAFRTGLSTFRASFGGGFPEDELVQCHRRIDVNRRCSWGALDRSEAHVSGFRGGKNDVSVLEWGTFVPFDECMASIRGCL